MTDSAYAKIDSVFAGLPFRVCLGLTLLCMIGGLTEAALVLFAGGHKSYFEAYLHALLVAVPYGFVGLLPALGIFWCIFRGSGADKVVVWLRRFHRHEPKRFPLPHFMTLVGQSDFQVATIQDSRFRFSYLTGATRSALKLIALQIILAFPAFLIAFFLAQRIVRWLEFSAVNREFYTALIAVPLIPIVAATVFVPAAIIAMRKYGAEALRNESDVKRIAKWIDRVQSGIGHILPGLKIFKCGDDFWMAAVQTMLVKCDAAIIDVSDLNENMRWELGQCIEIVPPKKLILAYAVPSHVYPMDPTDSLVDEIEELIGTDFLQRVIFWPYPEPFDKTLLRRFSISPLEETTLLLLDEALEAALHSEQSSVD